ncbi:MAG: SRPBCC family protein [Myxococcota bacterium]
MTTPKSPAINPKLDLLLERVVDVPRDLVWLAWTRPEHLKKWFTPAPWTTSECEIDLRPGGIFRFVNRSPEGQETTYVGCYLEIVEKERLVWTMALGPGFRPTAATSEVPTFTAVISMQPHGTGTRYTAMAMHRDEEGCKKHDQMGFHDGWGAATDQLMAFAKTL